MANYCLVRHKHTHTDLLSLVFFCYIYFIHFHSKILKDQNLVIRKTIEWHFIHLSVFFSFTSTHTHTHQTQSYLDSVSIEYKYWIDNTNFDLCIVRHSLPTFGYCVFHTFVWRKKGFFFHLVPKILLAM